MKVLTISSLANSRTVAKFLTDRFRDSDINRADNKKIVASKPYLLDVNTLCYADASAPMNSKICYYEIKQ
jgi:hypothetical protein